MRPHAARRSVFSGAAGIAGDATKVHQIDHRRRRAVLTDDVEHCGAGSESLSASTERDRHRQAEQPGTAERGNRALRERTLAIDARGIGTDLRGPQSRSPRRRSVPVLRSSDT